MNRRFAFPFFKWLAALVALGSLLVGAYLVHGVMQGERSEEAKGESDDAPERATQAST